MDSGAFLDVFFKNMRENDDTSDTNSSIDLFLWDTSDSDSDFLIEKESNKRARLEGFMECTVPNYSDVEYKKHFRLDRPTVKYVEMQIVSAFEKNMDLPNGRPCINCNTSLHLFLWYLGNRESIRQVCHRFNIAESTAHRLVHKVSRNIALLTTRFITLPPPIELPKLANDFLKLKGIVRVIGIIGMSHITIKKPRANSSEYFNKSSYSVIVQGVCDVLGQFLDIHVGEPGSLSQKKVLKRSALYNLMKNNPSHLQNYSFIGALGYPLLKWLVPPFSNLGDLSSGQKQFNSLHTNTSKIIEDTFNIVKSRFRRLNDLENLDLALISKCIKSACILHNICLNMGDNGKDLLLDYE